VLVLNRIVFWRGCAVRTVAAPFFVSHGFFVVAGGRLKADQLDFF
jgi:hypothetical protein